MDACLGKLLQGLKDLELDDDTIVVVWGDHGWKLGEHGSWCKQTNFDIDLQVPLQIRVPGVSTTGAACNQLVELVDLYPTVCDAAGIPIPTDMEGVSLKPLLANPNQQFKTAVFSQYHRNPRVSQDKKRYMGFSMVTQRYHYIQWRSWDHVAGVAGDEVKAVELYDLQDDPEENVNVAGEANNQALLAQLSKQLALGWKMARPK